jgi:ribonuclease Z
MTKVVFLGTGGAFSAGRRGNLALLIEHSNFRMLVESGPMVIKQLANVGLQAADIEHVFVSHAHGDHSLGFPMLALNRLGASTPLKAYAGGNTITILQVFCTLAFSNLKPQEIDIHWHGLPEEKLTKTALAPGVTLSTTAVLYPPGVPTLAARWDFADGTSVALVTDTPPSEAAIELASGCDLLIHEASFSAILQPGADAAAHFHSTAQQAGEVARRTGCQRLALVHLGPMIGKHPDILIEEARADTDLDVIVPEDGSHIEIAPQAKETDLVDTNRPVRHMATVDDVAP